jgi:thiol-disulfide isomerase/thioredoxin
MKKLPAKPLPSADLLNQKWRENIMCRSCLWLAVLSTLLPLWTADCVAETGGLIVQVVDEKGTPIEVTTVQVWVKTKEGSQGYSFAAYPTQEPGIVRVPDIPSGRYDSLTIPRLDYAPGRVSDVEIRAGRDTRLTCTLSPGGTIEGSVTDEAGQPVANVRVAVNSVLCRRDVVTDENGRFAAEHLSDADYSIIAEPAPESPYQISVFQGKARCGEKNARLVLKRKADAAPVDKPAGSAAAPPAEDRSGPDELAAAAARSVQAAHESMIGKPAPALVIERWYNGSFWQLNLNRKVVLLHFWGVWCGPCKRQLPQIRELVTKYADKGLVVIGVHTQAGKEALGAFLSGNDLPYFVAVDYGQRTNEMYRVSGYPTVAVIDKKGLIRAVNPQDLEHTITTLLSE